jgi:hypothetical protein
MDPAAMKKIPAREIESPEGIKVAGEESLPRSGEKAAGSQD